MRYFLTTILAAVLAAVWAVPASAQACYAENDGNMFMDNVSMGGPNLLLAIRFDAPADLDVTSMEVWTGEGSGTNSIGIWSHDAGGNEPDADLGTGTWSMSNTNSWQGAALSNTVSLTNGTTYWAVWGPQNFSQASLDPPKAFLGQVYRGSFNGGATWSGPFQFTDRHWKFRLNCSNPDPVTYCTAKSNLVCGTPAISWSGTASASATSGFVIEAGPARGNRSGLVLYSCAGRAAIPFQGGLLCVNPAPLRRVPPVNSGGTNGGCDGVFSVDFNTFASGNGGGNPDPCVVVVGQLVNTQWWGRDSVATGSFLSDGLEHVVGP